MYTTVRQRPGFYHDEFVRYYTSPCKVFYVGRVESGLSSFAFIFSVGSSVCRAHGRVVAHYDISQGPPASGVSDPLIGRTPTRRPYIRTPLTLLVYFSARPPSWGLVSAGAYSYFQPVLTILGVLPFIFRSSLWVWGSI